MTRAHHQLGHLAAISSRRESSERLQGRGELDATLSALPRARTSELNQLWQSLAGTPAPPGLSRDLLLRAIADRLQRDAFGGLPALMRRKFEAHVRNAKNEEQRPAPILGLKAGAKLVRDWGGKTHTVLIRQDGFEYQGKPYTSLSRIAEEITGAHWSGPRFFGLNARNSDATCGGSRDAA